MYNGDTISDMINYATTEYPEIDIRKSKKKFRQREYERIIINELSEYCFDNVFVDPIDILEDYEMVYIYLCSMHDNDIYKFQLKVIRKLLTFLKRRAKKYG